MIWFWFLLGLSLFGIGLLSLLSDLKGASIILLGPRGSGKTTLLEFLHKGRIYDKYNPTYDSYTVSGDFIRLEEFDFKIKSISDNPGSEYSTVSTDSIIIYRTLEDKKTKYDYIFYLFNAEKIYKNDERQIQNVREDTKLLTKYLKNGKIPVIGVVFIGTYEDKLYKGLDHGKRTTYTSEIKNHDAFRFILNELEKQKIPYKFLIGSLIKDGDRVSEFAKRILEACYDMKKTKSG